MTDYDPTLHDYRIGDIRYDARVVNAGGAYLLGDRDDWLAHLFGDDDVERRAAADRTALQAVFDARIKQVHRLVTWSRLDGRPVCTCGLALASPERLVGTNGHRDLLWEPLRTYVVALGDATSFAAACQDCGPDLVDRPGARSRLVRRAPLPRGARPRARGP